MLWVVLAVRLYLQFLDSSSPFILILGSYAYMVCPEYLQGLKCKATLPILEVRLDMVILIANIFQMGNAVIYFQNLFRRNLLVNCA
ncbi:hypothetical protein KSF78_0002128 [Schistosoma japonicum]|nr:hypothetical protein KSF78_0002128 [Schistosoma japonicum]KAH8855721.1 hypothetical protein KSF78_0002128 [Schistosoma japonicum]